MVESSTHGDPNFVEPTSPFAMEALLRAAVTATNGEVAGNVYFPYTRSFHDLQHYLNLRRRLDLGLDKFSLDLGVFSDSGDTFYSVGFADFKVKNRKGGKSPIGILCLGDPVYVPDKPFRVSRSSQISKDFEGIHVSPELRGQGIGRSLVSASRVILDELGIRVLMIDQIKTGPGQGGEFYRQLGGRRFEISKVASMCMPTRSTNRLPYVFR